MAHWRLDWQAAQAEATRLRLQGSTAQLQASELRREALEVELAHLQGELARQQATAAEVQRTALERLRVELTGSAEEQAALREAKEREARVERISQRAARRIANQGLIAGWTTWHDQWEEQAKQRRMLAAAGARLSRPQLAACVAHWRLDWQAAQAEATRLRLQGSTAQLQASELRREALEVELAHLQGELARQQATAAEVQRTALERLRVELTGSAEEQAALREAKEREARVERISQRAARRIANQGLIAGWTTWHDQWEEQAKQRRMLAAAGARLSRPQLAACLAHWRLDWQAAQAAAVRQRARGLTAQSEERVQALEAELAGVHDQYAQKLAAAKEAEKKALADLRVELAGSAEEQAALAEQQAREKRVEALAAKAMKRIQNAGLTAGWTAWHDQWEEQAKQRRMLAAAGARLSRPQLAACVAHWCADWRATALLEATKGPAREVLLLKQQLEAQQAEHSRALAAAVESGRVALERLRVELAGSAEEQAALAEQQAREKRVEALAAKAMKRIQNAGLTAGWTAWHDQWEEQAKQRRMLAAAGARLSRPQLAACVAHWRLDWQAARAEAAAKQRTEERTADAQRISELMSELQAARQEGAHASLALLAADDDRAALRARLQQLGVEQQEASAELRAARAQLAALREEAGGNEARAAEAARALAADELAAQREAAAALQDQMKRLLAEQRQQLDAELEGARAGAARAEGLQAQCDAAEKTIGELRDEIERLKAAARKPSAPAAAPAPAPTPAANRRGGSSVLGAGFDVDEDSEKSVGQQLKEAMKANAVRVIDLFREWDTDGDGEVSRKEFHKAMPMLGFDASKKEIDALFDSWDPDGGGSIDFKELQRALRGDAAPSGAAAVKAAGGKLKTMNSVAKAMKSSGKG